MTNGNSADTQEFRRQYEQLKTESDNYRKKTALALLILFIVAVPAAGAMVVGVMGAYYGSLDIIILWLAAVAVVLAPLVWWVRIMEARRHESLTLAHGFLRKAIVEERLFNHAGDDAEERKRLHRLYMEHWMEKSPLEVLLALRGKEGGRSFMAPVHTAINRVMSGNKD